MPIPDHLREPPTWRYKQFPVIGEVRGVLAPEHPDNPTGFTLYQCVAHLQEPCHTATLPPLAYMGQMAGGNNEKETPLEIGVFVVILFLEGSENRGVILGEYPNHNTKVVQREAEHPRNRWLHNGVETTIDKDGKVIVKRKANQPLEIQDEDGTVRLQVAGDGTVKAGKISASMEAVIDARIVEKINAMDWVIPALTVGGGGSGTTLPSKTSGVANSTEIKVADVTASKVKVG